MSARLLIWAVGPDPEGRWHFALAPRKPHPWLRTGEPAVCGYPAPTVSEGAEGQLVRVWQTQQREPAGTAVCGLCAAWAQRRQAWTPRGVAV